jgi:hypothetical protein
MTLCNDYRLYVIFYLHKLNPFLIIILRSLKSSNNFWMINILVISQHDIKFNYQMFE